MIYIYLLNLGKDIREMNSNNKIGKTFKMSFEKKSEERAQNFSVAFAIFFIFKQQYQQINVNKLQNDKIKKFLGTKQKNSKPTLIMLFWLWVIC